MARLLVVDDEPALLSRIQRTLEQDGHRVFTARSLHEARDLVDAGRYHGAVVDLRLGDGSGLDLLRWLRREHPSCARLLVSGYLDAPTTMSALNNGEVTRVVQKPFSPNNLRRMVADALEQTRAGLEPEGTPEQRQRLEHLLSGQDLVLALQPVVQASSGAVVAYEGLIRGQEDGLVTPDAIVGAARQHRMLKMLTHAVLERAGDRLTELPEDLNLFINLHPDELADMGMLMRELTPLEPYAHRVVIDINGHHAERWGDALRPRLDQLKQLGMRVAIDDVGAGHQDLLLLAEAEPDFIKADQSIVKDIARSAQKRRVLEILTHFGEAVDARLIAEGVETAADAAVLADAGVPLMQGHLFGPPASDVPTPD